MAAVFHLRRAGGNGGIDGNGSHGYRPMGYRVPVTTMEYRPVLNLISRAVNYYNSVAVYRSHIHCIAGFIHGHPIGLRAGITHCQIDHAADGGAVDNSHRVVAKVGYVHLARIRVSGDVIWLVKVAAQGRNYCTAGGVNHCHRIAQIVDHVHPIIDIGYPPRAIAHGNR